MTIYTKTGDDGTTALYGGKRVLKSDLRVAAYGSLDELSSCIGFAMTMLTDVAHRDLLTTVQKDLHTICAGVSGKKTNLDFLEKRVKTFEDTIDKIQNKLPALHAFILPQGTKQTSWFHILRTVCRRSERALVCLSEKEKIEREIIKYINRLSDLFFALARVYNTKKEITV